MDYRVRRKKSELDSTGYMEIGPGKYSGMHWQEGFLFVRDEAFIMAAGIVAKHVPYDHYTMMDVPKEAGNEIIAEWRDVADRLEAMSADQARAALNRAAAYFDWIDAEIEAHKAEIASMLWELADGCAEFYERGDWVCILGM